MSLNKVILIGNLGRDPEVRYMPNGDAVCNFSIATSETWTDKNSGNKQDRTEWHNITMYRRLAEIAGQYLKKGSQVYVEGKIQSRKYTDKNNVERTAYDIICHEMKMLGSRNSNDNTSNWDNSSTANQPHDEYHSTPNPPPAPQQRANIPVAPIAPVEDIDDDIPF